MALITIYASAESSSMNSNVKEGTAMATKITAGKRVQINSSPWWADNFLLIHWFVPNANKT